MEQFKQAFFNKQTITESNSKVTKIAKDGIDLLKDLMADSEGEKNRKSYSIRIQAFQKAIKTQTFTFDQVQWLIDSGLIKG